MPVRVRNADGDIEEIASLDDLIGSAGTPADNVQSTQSPNALLRTATIANGASLSDAVDFGAARLAMIIMPAAWTAADLTFQVSADGVTYVDLYDDADAEREVAAAASRALEVGIVLGVRYLKVRSGTVGTPVAQAGARSLTLVGEL